MTDFTTKEPLRVSTDPGAPPYIDVPFEQLGEVERLLDSRGVKYWVEDDIISIDEGPEIATLDLAWSEDASAVQALLDSVQ